jgi:hypothetical protein
MGAMENEVEKTIAKKQPIDVPRFNRLISKHIAQMHEILVELPKMGDR